ncbi:hypothetical protein IWQ47_000246 [Aquimarina sp. EL_43]|uniref:hypothetical protein n=1 Tax=unclassified Aquimarina TaxID=2627091 RepID=UPI0018C9F498|nr:MULTISPECIES: hypothetical protein [unclassified Aquimarina]MBG6129062.1 hypothetical protein [Aquimarina sp. EL_35]MBG6150126.1 hypothetical protein [Aquimarina sp. EL_32]MBG6167188.1 hypothetical protein [Aquimarina sp. EL_43]
MTVLLTIITILMGSPLNTELIGKHISEIPSAKLNVKEISYNSYTITPNTGIYLGKPYQSFSIVTDKNDVIKELSIRMNHAIDKSFFNRMVEEYGDPFALYKIDEILETKTSFHEDGGSSTSSKGSMKKCTFEEDPIFIIWNIKEQSIIVKIKRQGSFPSTSISLENKGFWR